MAFADELRQRARATWAAGDWDGFARLIIPVGARALDRVGVEPGMDLLDVGTGSGGNVAIPAALRGARVVGLDVTPELLEHARRRAAEAGVDVEWVEGDAQDLPFEDERSDRVISTFGAMFAPDHARAAAKLVRAAGPAASSRWRPGPTPASRPRCSSSPAPSCRLRRPASSRRPCGASTSTSPRSSAPPA
jgi:2-polyprenyl-3-methyl-5-hydroxy-6-metoxy-1,4-benzoquinol methylase